MQDQSISKPTMVVIGGQSFNLVTYASVYGRFGDAVWGVILKRTTHLHTCTPAHLRQYPDAQPRFMGSYSVRQ